MMGSGGMVVMDERSCMVDVAKYFMEFIQNESCGKCTPCREGTTRMHEILDGAHRASGRGRDRRGWNASAACSTWRSWPRRSRTPRSAVWASRPPTRCSRPCGSSATSTRPTSWRIAARRESARDCAPTAIDTGHLHRLLACKKACPSTAPSWASAGKPTTSSSTAASAAAPASTPARSNRSRGRLRGRHVTIIIDNKELKFRPGRDRAAGGRPRRHQHPPPLFARLGPIALGVVPPLRGRSRRQRPAADQLHPPRDRRHERADPHAAAPQGPAGDSRAAWWRTTRKTAWCAIASGTCELADLAQELGVRPRQYVGMKKDQTLDISSPAIWRDPNKCVLCGRCVTMCHDVQGMGAIDFTGRGFRTQVAPGFDPGINVSGCMLLRAVRPRLPHRGSHGAQPGRFRGSRTGRPRYGGRGADSAGGPGHAEQRPQQAARACR